MTSDNGRRRALIHGSEKLICFDNDAYCKLYDVVKDPTRARPDDEGRRVQGHEGPLPSAS